MSFVTDELRNGVLQATENEILNGDGTGVRFAGLLNQTTQSVTVGALTELDTIYAAIDTVRANFNEPDAVVLSQTDAQTIRLQKDSIEGYLMGDPSGAGADTLFGKRLVVSPLMPAGTGLVGAFASGATIYDRHEPRIAWASQGLSATGEDLFIHNQVRARAEERVGFVVNRPAAFCEIDFTP